MSVCLYAAKTKTFHAQPTAHTQHTSDLHHSAAGWEKGRMLCVCVCVQNPKKFFIVMSHGISNACMLKPLDGWSYRRRKTKHSHLLSLLAKLEAFMRAFRGGKKDQNVWLLQPGIAIGRGNVKDWRILADVAIVVEVVVIVIDLVVGEGVLGTCFVF